MSNVEENEGKSKTEYQPVTGCKDEEQAKTETKPTAAVPLEYTLSQAQQPFQYHANSTPLVVSLRNVESHLETDTDNRKIWLSELSSKVNEFVDTEYRILPTFACDTGGTSPLGKTFDRVKGLLENRIILLEEEIVLFDATIDSLSDVIDSVQNSMVEQLRNNTQLKDEIRDQKDIIRDEKDKIAKEQKIIAKEQKIIAKELKIIGDQKDKISQHHAILTNGTFFSSLDDVWTAGEKYTNIPTVDGRVFKRDIHVLSNEMEDSNSFEDIFGCYEKTAIGALNSENEVIENSSRTSQRSESISAEAEAEAEVDIFGGKIEGSESAHLMPHSSSCAALWYTFVESVLSLSPGKEQESFNESNWWKVLQKSIHGYGKSKTKGADKRDKSGNSTESKSDKDEQDKNSASIKVRKTANVGIKHFATNRIRLHCQALHLDKNPCLLIIPVMDNKQVKEWDGGGYYAIVLAGPILKKKLKKSSTIDSKETIAKEGKVGEIYTNSASFIYRQIEAWDGGVEGEFLATNEDLEKSRILLETAVLCIAKASKASYGPIDADCPPEIKQRHEDVKKGLGDAIKNADEMNGGKIKETFEKLLTLNSVKVPANKNHSDTFDSKYVKVRKILFSSRVAGQSAHLHLAPDPMLLLAKAASNWLRRQDMLLLPGFEVVSDDSSSSVGYDEECKARGWHRDKKQRITEITIQCRSSICTDVESISDLDC